jgi:hypothetical protein
VKKVLRKVLVIFIIFVSIVLVLNITVTSQQGIDFQQHTIMIPLYLKILDFFDRNFNYRELVKRIVKDVQSDQEKIMKIFEWTYRNIKKQPKELPVVDDHVWHIIVRGYGISDQFSDVFTTLCNYADIESWFSFITTMNKHSRIPLSFVRLDSRMCVFDPFNGVYFENSDGELASIQQIRRKAFTVKYLRGAPRQQLNYLPYLENIANEAKQKGLKRAQIQSPMKRLLFGIRRQMK